MKEALSGMASARTLKLALGLVVGFFFLYLALRNVLWSEVLDVISLAAPGYIALSFGVVLLNIFLKIARWNFLLNSSGALLKFKDVSASFISAQLLNSLVPIRVGEITRVYHMGSRGATPAFVVGTLFAEKYLDLIAYAILIALLFVWVPLPNWMGETVSLFGIFALLTSLGLLIFVMNSKRMIHVVDLVSQRFPAGVQSFILKNTHSGFASLAVFQSGSKILVLILLTLSIWATALWTNQIILLALGIHAPAETSFLALAAIQAGLSLPGLPGKIGVFEYACILVMEFLGFSHSYGLSYGILLHIVVYAPIIIFGWMSLVYLQAKSPDHLPG